MRIGRFYARRVRRLLPAALVAIVATSLTFLLVTSVVRRIPLVGDAQSALLYVANWRFLGQSTDYFAADVQESPFLHFWSLAIEEQFYLVFPLLLVALTRTPRGRPARLVGGLSALLALSLTAQLVWAQVDPMHAYYGTDARLYQLLAGALLGSALRGRTDSQRRPAAAALATLVALPCLLVLGSGLLSLSPSVRGIAATGASVLLIGGLVGNDRTPIARLLSRPVPVFLGRVSYGTYLWHWPVILVLEMVLVVDAPVVAVAAAVLSTALAALSYEVLELPIRRSAGLSRFTWQTAVVGLAASVLVAVTVVPLTLAAQRRRCSPPRPRAPWPPGPWLPRAAGPRGCPTTWTGRRSATTSAHNAGAHPRRWRAAWCAGARDRTCSSSATARPRCWPACSPRWPRTTT